MLSFRYASGFHLYRTLQSTRIYRAALMLAAFSLLLPTLIFMQPLWLKEVSAGHGLCVKLADVAAPHHKPSASLNSKASIDLSTAHHSTPHHAKTLSPLDEHSKQLTSKQNAPLTAEQLVQQACEICLIFTLMLAIVLIFLANYCLSFINQSIQSFVISSYIKYTHFEKHHRPPAHAPPHFITIQLT